MQVMDFYVELSHRIHSRGLQGRYMGSSNTDLLDFEVAVRNQTLCEIPAAAHSEWRAAGANLGGSDSSCSPLRACSSTSLGGK